MQLENKLLLHNLKANCCHTAHFATQPCVQDLMYSEHSRHHVFTAHKLQGVQQQAFYALHPTLLISNCSKPVEQQTCARMQHVDVDVL